MLVIKNLKVKLAEEKKIILDDVSLTIKPSEVHILQGRNGSGKSTLVNAIMGNPSFEVISGSIKIINEKYPKNIIDSLTPSDDEEVIYSTSKGEAYDIDLTHAEANERSLAGLYLASQYPVEIPGVNLMQYLRLIYNIRQPKSKKLPVFKFKKLLVEKCEIINYPQKLLSRNLNEGFSGGEKKKTEILQMLLLEPRYVLLDEIDSGLDKESVKEVFGGLSQIRKAFAHMSFVIITHYDRAFEYLPSDFIHEMKEGRIETKSSKK